jgi:anaerobic selenocysteine-containing dehydrogenase
MAEAIAKIPYVASLGSFIDETSVWADLILPDHAPLESWLDDVPAAGAVSMVAGLAPPAVHPLHNTRAMPDVILDLGHQLGGSIAAALPWKTYDDMLQAAFLPLRKHSGSIDAKDDDEFWTKAQQQGGWWSVPTANGTASRATDSVRAGSAAPAAPAGRAASKFSEPQFDGAPGDFPFYFLPYASQALGDGSLAHLPWLQEMPDVLTTAMWSSWVELNPQTAERLKILPGELVEITSQHGSVRVPAVLSPGIAPDLVAVPIGQGHVNFSRYASHRGANPLAILAPLTEPETGSLAWAATRVKVARVGGVDQAKLILYAGGMSGFPHEEEPHR